jgi:hypothetical protein
MIHQIQVTKGDQIALLAAALERVSKMCEQAQNKEYARWLLNEAYRAYGIAADLYYAEDRREISRRYSDISHECWKKLQTMQVTE